MLAQARETIPSHGELPGGMITDPKFDGFRALLFTPVEDGQPVLLQSRRGAMYQGRFPGSGRHRQAALQWFLQPAARTTHRT